ncbi:MAG: TerB family tellurite resistance protein [Salinibacter sp.]|uniref:tellurite resistance TerB family protein n=1 Tax=Salinibacter sp. TaxID=2065818 RepID=UPI0035D40990
MRSSEDWTTPHKLAIVYIALAYGTDHVLSDEELEALEEALREWEPMEAPSVREVIMEAATVFLEGDAQTEVRRAIRELDSELSPQERRETLRHVIRIAEADGVLLEREQGLIHTLADAWSLKQLGEELVADTSAVVQRRGEDWGLIHELAFLYVLAAHSADEALASDKIDAMLDRLQEWQPDLSYEEVRAVLRRALQVYADQPDESLIHDSVEALKEALPSVQRLTILDDLHTIMSADGPLTRNERQLLLSLAQAWEVNVRLNGQG